MALYIFLALVALYGDAWNIGGRPMFRTVVELPQVYGRLVCQVFPVMSSFILLALTNDETKVDRCFSVFRERRAK